MLVFYQIPDMTISNHISTTDRQLPDHHS